MSSTSWRRGSSLNPAAGAPWLAEKTGDLRLYAEHRASRAVTITSPRFRNGNFRVLGILKGRSPKLLPGSFSLQRRGGAGAAPTLVHRMPPVISYSHLRFPSSMKLVILVEVSPPEKQHRDLLDLQGNLQTTRRQGILT